eukprot:403370686
MEQKHLKRMNLAVYAMISFTCLIQYSQQQKLVDIYDMMRVYDQSKAQVDSFYMTSFPYIDAYQRNVSTFGKMCFAPTWQNFLDQCKSTQPDTTNWVVLNPFSQKESNDIITNATQGLPTVETLIFITNDFISSNRTYVQPEIISLVSQNTGDKLKAYIYNNQQQNVQNFNISIDHVFINNCYLLNPIWPTYLALTGLWLVIVVVWWYLTFIKFKQHSMYLQKTLTIIPVCKILETLITGLFLNACPWISVTEPSEKYLDMARISIVTITYTILLAILFLISKGWNTTAFSLTRNQATYLTMIMGAVYLTYSAYFLSADFIGISYFMKGLMAVLYLGLGLVNLKNLRETINMIKGYQTQSMRDNPNDIMLPALKLKETILKRFTVMMLGYFILKIIKYGLISFLGDETLSERFSLAVQCFDLVFLGASLFIFRSRFWPSFYRLGLNELAVPFLNNLDGGNRNMYLAPMLETSITQKLLSDKYINENTDRCDSIGSDEVVVILNPTKYTINDDEDMDKMDAEDIVSSLNDSRGEIHINDRKNIPIESNDIMHQLKLAYKEKSRRSRTNNRQTSPSPRRGVFSQNRQQQSQRRLSNNSDTTDDEDNEDEEINPISSQNNRR